MVYHLIFLFQSCRLLNTILSFHNNREFHSSILGVIFGVILCFLGVISLALSIILCLLGVILNFLSTFFVSVYFSVYIFAIKSTIFIIQRIIFIVQGFTLGFTLGFIWGFTESFGVHIIVLPFYSINYGKCEIITLFQLGLCENIE